MRLYSVVTAEGSIALSRVSASARLNLQAGERLIPDNPPQVDEDYQVCTRVLPVPADAVEVGYAVTWRPLQLIQARRREELNRERDRLEATTFPYLGRTFDCTPRAVQRISTAVQAAQAAIAGNIPFELTWTDADNADVALTAVQITNMPLALAAWGNELHQVCRTLKQQVDEATTPEGALAVTWSA